MAGPPPGTRIVGTMPDGAWIGFRVSAEGYDLVVGRGEFIGSRPAGEDELLALALAHFEEALDAPPADLEATHADLSELVRSVAGNVGDPGRRSRLVEAVDAIDDGLAGDAVAARLAASRREAEDEQVDPVDLLVMRARELAG